MGKTQMQFLAGLSQAAERFIAKDDGDPENYPITKKYIVDQFGWLCRLGTGFGLFGGLIFLGINLFTKKPPKVEEPRSSRVFGRPRNNRRQY